MRLSGEPNGGALLRRIREAGEVRVGFANEAPYSFVDANAEFTGEAAELARIVFCRLGVDTIVPIPAEFGSLIAGLKVGLFDVIGAGMAILPSRCRQVIYTNHEFVAPAALLVRKGNPDRLSDFADVAENPRVRIGVIAGSAEQVYARSARVASTRITSYPAQSNGLDAVCDGRIAAFASTTISLRYLLSENPGAPLEISDPSCPWCAERSS